MFKNKLNVNKIIKTHNKLKYLGKKYFLINQHFINILFYKIEHISIKSRKWVFNRLAKKRLVLNYRSLFNKQKVINLNSLDPIKKIFFKLEFCSLISLDYYHLTDFHIELIRRLAKKIFGKRVFIVVNISATKNILRRANQVRMGGGKGSKFFKKIYFIYPGCNILEIRGINKKFINLFFSKLKKKMPFLFKIILFNRC